MTPQLKEKKKPVLRFGEKRINIQREEATDKCFSCSLFKNAIQSDYQNRNDAKPFARCDAAAFNVSLQYFKRK